ncbi:hypothetical protein BofuT4_P129060.1 [Botrytis cinerea T4]|uniref:Uncharacterized protein n=1 Tax=Botryotinia fuckeliana (strain T4) TaxID=999810 RepID=G2YRF8_BOTF4|nr:hypothetical protein BofuT4_P129060.1 [Botrytis cinerea T4]
MKKKKRFKERLYFSASISTATISTHSKHSSSVAPKSSRPEHRHFVSPSA